jgi:hypothetical protein
MRQTMVSLPTLLLLAGSHARVQVTGSIDPTDLKVGVLNIDAGVRAAIAAERKNVGSVTASSFVINDHAKPQDCRHFFLLRPDPI